MHSWGLDDLTGAWKNTWQLAISKLLHALPVYVYAFHTYFPLYYKTGYQWRRGTDGVENLHSLTKSGMGRRHFMKKAVGVALSWGGGGEEGEAMSEVKNRQA